MWEGVPEDLAVAAAVTDKAYDSEAIGRFLAGLGMEAGIPPRANRAESIHYDAEKYKMREKVERWFNKLKQFRRIATRYDKLARTFLAFIHLAATWIMTRSFANADYNKLYVVSMPFFFLWQCVGAIAINNLNDGLLNYRRGILNIVKRSWFLAVFVV